MTRRQYLALKKHLEITEVFLSESLKMASRLKVEQDVLIDLKTASDKLADAKHTLIADMEERNE